MRSLVPLLLLLCILCVGALIHQQSIFNSKLPEIPLGTPQNIVIMPQQVVSHTTEWDSMRTEPPLVKIHVVVTTTFREQPHPTESKEEFRQRHLDAVAAELLINPDNCP